ncbi:MAG: IS91 family transposase, partial [Proteobacteria bacterium]|nr:IS91 family transposase [Pseudomonadota bacterium]
MNKTEKGVYHRRHPGNSDYYRMIEAHYEEFERCYEDLFEEKRGFLRNEVLKSIYRFLDCGLPENGVARIHCDDCGPDYFVAFSCRCRVICPSCSTKRSLLFGEKIAEIVKPIPR